MKATIKVQTSAQKVLLDTELLGQFSDGYWENSRNQSWEYLNNVEITKDEEPGVYFKANVPYNYKGYSVNNTELLSYVGERMLAKAKIANFFNISTISNGLTSVLEDYKIENLINKNKEITSDDINNVIEKCQAGSDYCKKRADVALEQIDELGGVDKIIEALNSSYDIKAMRKDLREITKILKTTFKGN